MEFESREEFISLLALVSTQEMKRTGTSPNVRIVLPLYKGGIDLYVKLEFLYEIPSFYEATLAAVVLRGFKIFFLFLFNLTCTTIEPSKEIGKLKGVFKI